jgi:hypothetical protein
MPCKNDNDTNIHGHIHGYKTYWIPYKNQVDVAALGGRVTPVELNKVIGAQKSYSKTIKEDKSHFEEGYYVTNTGDVFNEVMGELTIVDPFND